MVNYVNTVLVSGKGAIYTGTMDNLKMSSNAVSTEAGKFIIADCDPDAAKAIIASAADVAKAYTIKVGLITKKNAVIRKKNAAPEYMPIIKWSNEIKAGDIKNYSKLTYTADTEDEVTINLRNFQQANIMDNNGNAVPNRRIIVRITYKDMPHRYRKWTESYEYTTEEGDTINSIAQGIVALINNEYKRARVIAELGTASAGANAGDPDTVAKTQSGSESSANAIVLTALPYDDDDSVDSLNWANKVRFNVNMYWTNPEGEGWESNNKHYPNGVEIKKTPGKQYPASAKLVRDREAWAMGYLGILNRGEGTWPIIKPAMETDLAEQYDAITLEFENMYRAADDIQRKTKQTLEIYVKAGELASGNFETILDAFVNGQGELEGKDNH